MGASWPSPATSASPARRPSSASPRSCSASSRGAAARSAWLGWWVPARAKDLIFSGRQVRADEALAMGLVDEVVPHDEVFDRALDKAAALAAGAVAAQGLAKRAIDRGLDITLNGGLDLEQQLFAEVFTTDDANIGVHSFLESGPGKATFTGH